MTVQITDLLDLETLAEGFFCSPLLRPDQLWGPPSFLSNVYLELLLTAI